MNWQTIIGSRGVCKVGMRTYNGNQYNEVKAMLYPEDVDQTKVLNGQAVQQSYQYQAQPQYQTAPQPQNTAWNNGTAF